MRLPPYIGYIGSKSSLAAELDKRKPSEAREASGEVFAGGVGYFLATGKASSAFLAR